MCQITLLGTWDNKRKRNLCPLKSYIIVEGSGVGKENFKKKQVV